MASRLRVHEVCINAPCLLFKNNFAIVKYFKLGRKAVIWWCGSMCTEVVWHGERMDEKRMAKKVLISNVEGNRCWGRSIHLCHLFSQGCHSQVYIHMLLQSYGRNCHVIHWAYKILLLFGCLVIFFSMRSSWSFLLSCYKVQLEGPHKHQKHVWMKFF